MISPKNFFLFTPLLPSVAVGTLGAKSVLQRTLHHVLDHSGAHRLFIATRYTTRHKARQVSVIEAEATAVDVREPFPCPSVNSTQHVSACK